MFIQNTDDRRKDSRIYSRKVFSHYKVELHSLKEDTKLEMVNISEKGIGLFSKWDLNIDINQIIELTIINMSTKVSFFSEARLAWKNRNSNSKEGGYLLGCEFIEPIELPDDILAINFALEDNE